ncbi:hypothetical protein HEP84_06370 [Streptomyces sp. RLB1-33]|nr:hypothetical protein [Streptomyces sp. RLB1-33]QIY68884.1 hypothetical protein HEP84_06370 [Streptomyces sp. RLB1-33]
MLTDLKFVRELSALKELALFEFNQLTHIEDLAGLPPPNLSLFQMPDEFSFDALDSLTELTDLSLYTRLPWESLAELPAPEGLTSLSLGRWIGTRLAGVSRWQQLQDLVINAAPDNGEWQEISALPHLTELCMSDYDLNHAVPMHSITYLRLLPTSDPQLELVPDLFPDLERIFINCRGAQPDTADITPLSRIKGLQISISYASNVIDLEGFTPDAVRLYPRPRTAST